jgi:hypothetical protein
LLLFLQKKKIFVLFLKKKNQKDFYSLRRFTGCFSSWLGEARKIKGLRPSWRGWNTPGMALMQLGRWGSRPGQRFAATCLALALSLTAVPHRAAAQATGYLDSVSGDTATGWACIPGAETAANVALYAGAHRIGIYPPSDPRPETQQSCGAAAGTAGFRIDLTPVVAQQFLYQSGLSFFALSPNAAPYLLPPSDPSLSDPLPLPTGLLTNLSGDGVLSGLVTGTNGRTQAPEIDIYAGGPANGGGQLIGRASLGAPQPGASSQAFTQTLPGATLQNLPAGYLPSLYATGNYGAGPAAQLGSPAMPGAGFAKLYANVTQTGAVSGTTNGLYTNWISGNYVFMGMTGSVSFVGNDASFSQALVTVGYTNDNQASCLKKNATAPASAPPFHRLAGVIMKSTDATGDVLPVSITLPYGVPLSGPTGTCLVLWINAGYPFLSPYAAKYANTNSRLAVMVAPPQPHAPIAIAEGFANEYRFPSGTSDSQYTLMSMRLNAQMQVDAIAGSLSAGGVSGAPGNSGFLPTPSGNWTATTSFLAFNAADCAALGLSYGPGNAYFAVAHGNTPDFVNMPSDARLLLTVPLHGLAAIPTEQSFFQTFSNPDSPSNAPLTLQPGECLVAVHNVASPTGSLSGVLDFENQSTVYFHVLK